MYVTLSTREGRPILPRKYRQFFVQKCVTDSAERRELREEDKELQGEKVKPRACGKGTAHLKRLNCTSSRALAQANRTNFGGKIPSRVFSKAANARSKSEKIGVVIISTQANVAHFFFCRHRP